MGSFSPRHGFFTPLSSKDLSKLLLRVAALLVLTALVCLIVSAWLFWSGVNQVLDAARSGVWPESPFGDGAVKWVIEVEHTAKDGGKKRTASLDLQRSGDERRLTLNLDGRKEAPVSLFWTAAGYTLHAGTGATFFAAEADPKPVKEALSEAAALLPRLSLIQRVGITPATRPMLVEYSSEGRHLCWKIKVKQGTMTVFSDGAPVASRLRASPAPRMRLVFNMVRWQVVGLGEWRGGLFMGAGCSTRSRRKHGFQQKEAEKLIERQRPFIQSAYFDEMHGLAEGTGLPLDLIQMMNIFPEFFHYSGVALMGEATKGGTLLHARVLDYMVGVGLQDDPAVMAIERPGKSRFVTMGYLGFIGSVTGMNEHHVAIGEMDGAGQGDWDRIQ